jgi:Zn-dependent protease
VDFSQYLILFPVLLFSVVAHEYAHGYAALRQGDPTAYQLGRLTLNPIKHIDLFMTILLPAVLILAGAPFILGGAKPVPVNPRNYRNFKRGDIIVSLAGVATNFMLAIVLTFVFALIGVVGGFVPAGTGADIVGGAQRMAAFGVLINLVLIAFNLIPIPPLDGSHVMKYILPPAWSLRYQQIGGFGIMLLMLMLWFFPDVFYAWMGPALWLARTLLASVSRFALPGSMLPL